MKNLMLVMAFLIAVSCPALADVGTFDFAAVAGSSIQFTGTGTAVDFTLLSTTVNGHSGIDFVITDSVLKDLYGAISGTYEYSNSAISVTGPTQTAPVSGASGVFTIWDASWQPLTADVTWDSIATTGTGGIVNYLGTVDLSNFAYSGANPDLQYLAQMNSGVLVTTFQFTAATSLTALETGTHTTSYSGSVTPVPDGGLTAMLLGGVLVGLETLRRKFRV